jgi:topoisomerase-4 subunit A
VWQRLEKAKTDAAVRKQVWDGMQENALLFVRPMTEDDVDRLLKIHIRRISAYDIARYRAQMQEIDAAIKSARGRLRNLTKTTITYLEGLLVTYGRDWPRRTQIATFQSVDKKAVSLQNIKVTFDPESGFIGAAVKSGARTFTMSDYDRLLAISDDGTYRIIGPEDKVLLPGKVMHLELFDPEKGEHFTVVYRDRDNMAFGKRIHIHSFIKGREYRLIKGPRGKVALLLQEEEPGKVHLTFVRKPRQRVNEGEFDLSILTPTNPGALGRRLASKPVSRIKRIR